MAQPVLQKNVRANAHDLNFHTDLIDDGSRLTLSEITDSLLSVWCRCECRKNCVDALYDCRRRSSIFTSNVVYGII